MVRAILPVLNKSILATTDDSGLVVFTVVDRFDEVIDLNSIIAVFDFIYYELNYVDRARYMPTIAIN